MIRKFLKINYGSYEDFSWDNLQEFQKLNIFYGRNYAGKTTLSRILRSFEVKNPHSDYINSIFEIQTTDNSLTQENITDNDLTIRVYNKDFVKDNLGFLIDDKVGDIKAFASVVIGEENNKIQAKIQELQNKLGNEEDKENNIFVSGLYEELQVLKDEKENIDKEKKDKKYNQDEKLRKKARQMKANPNFVTQGRNYDIRNIGEDIENIKASSSNFILKDNEKQAKKDLISDEIKETLDSNGLSFNANRLSEFIAKSRILIETKITPKQDIENQLRSWLDEGLKLHEHSKDTQQCKFCNNTLTQERIQWLLENIKDNEADLIKAEIGAYCEEIKGMEKDSKKVLDEVRKIEWQRFYKNLRKSFDEDKRELEIEIGHYNHSLSRLREKLECKSKNIYYPIVFPDVKNPSEEIQQILDSIKALCTQNNEQTKTLKQDQQSARKALRLDEVANFIQAIDYFGVQKEINELKNALGDKDKEIRAKEQEIKEIKKEIQALQDSLDDEKAGADKANKYLKSFFGNNQLEFKSIPEKKGEFTIRRNNEAAKNLSDGECSLLAFCYFVAKLQDKDTKDKKPIIWIDDPICSLDNNHIFFIFSLIESQIAKPKNYTQLFISTHNLDFLRYLKSLTGFQRRNNKTPMFLIEKQQSSIIKDLPPHMQKYITEFNYLFEQIYHSRKEDNTIETETFYNLANNIRKFLESYLFFKYPNTDSLMSKYKKFFKDNQEAVFINRIINEFSHLEENPERANKPLDLLEIQKVSKIVIETIQQKDREQFKALLESIGEDKNTNNDK